MLCFELLVIRYCGKITNDTLIVAVEETKKRTNNVILEMRIYKTAINVNEITDKSPLLHLVHSIE